MERQNYFEILNLDFDPPKNDQKEIDRAIDIWEKGVREEFAVATSDSRRKVLQNRLDQLGDMKAVMSSPESRKKEAGQLLIRRVGQLEQIIDIMLIGQEGTPLVTNAMIRSLSIKLKLSQATIRKTYQKKGFEIQPPRKNNMNDYFLLPTIEKSIRDNILTLQSVKVTGAPWTSKAKDLYDYACYFSRGSNADPSAFHTKKTPELRSIMESGSARYTGDISVQGHTMADVFSAGATQVFNSEENRRKYDRCLDKQELAAFFALLKAAPDDFKRDRYFADRCIKTIQKKFSNYSIALALYNHEAGLNADPYEPIEAVIHMVCGSCRAPLEFRSREEAERACCPVCGASLFIECPKCRKMVPASADRCPNEKCGFPISEMQFFDDYLKAAELALKEMNLSEARKQLEYAKKVYPGHGGIQQLEKRILEVESVYKKPIEKVNSLIEAAKYYEAQEKLEKLRATMPHLRMDEQKKIIDEKIRIAEGNMPDRRLPDYERANKCEEILQIVKDYKPALDMLKTIRPQKPAGLKASVSGTYPPVCTLSWNSTDEKGVMYRIIRKVDSAPAGLADGKVLAEGISELYFDDRTIEPGISYWYAVCAVRRGACSDLSVCLGYSFSELDSKKVKSYSDNSGCHFSWVLPRNCKGVRVLKKTGGIPEEEPTGNTIVAANNASTHFDDTDVVRNQTYGYRLQCIYPHRRASVHSRGVTISIRFEELPVPLEDIHVTTKGRRVKVTWASDEKVAQKVTFRQIESNMEKWIGKVLSDYEIDSLTRSSTPYANADSAVKEAEFDIPANSAFSLAIICLTGSKGIIAGIENVSSVEGCEIDKERTHVEGDDQIHLYLKQPFSEFLQTIYYQAAEKVDDVVPWANAQDARDGRMTAVSAARYMQDEMILVSGVPQTELYISVIGFYKFRNGQTLYSDPSRFKISNAPKKKITYDFSWKRQSFLGLWGGRPDKKDCTLTLTCDAQETPEIYVLYSLSGRIPQDLKDPDCRRILLIPEQDHGFIGGKYEYRFPDTDWENIPSGTNIRLFIDKAAMTEFEISAVDVNNCKVP